MLSLLSLPHRVPRVEVSRPGPSDLRSWCQTAARWPQLRAPVQTLRTAPHPRWRRRAGCREAAPPPDRSLSGTAAPARLGKTTPPLRAVEVAIDKATAGGGRLEHLLWSGSSRVFTLWSEKNAFLAFGTELSLIPLARAGIAQEAPGCDPAPEVGDRSCIFVASVSHCGVILERSYGRALGLAGSQVKGPLWVSLSDVTFCPQAHDAAPVVRQVRTPHAHKDKTMSSRWKQKFP